MRTLPPRIMVQWKKNGWTHLTVWQVTTTTSTSGDPFSTIYLGGHPFFTEPWVWEERYSNKHPPPIQSVIPGQDFRPVAGYLEPIPAGRTKKKSETVQGFSPSCCWIAPPKKTKILYLERLLCVLYFLGNWKPLKTSNPVALKIGLSLAFQVFKDILGSPRCPGTVTPPGFWMFLVGKGIPEPNGHKLPRLHPRGDNPKTSEKTPNLMIYPVILRTLGF